MKLSRKFLKKFRKITFSTLLISSMMFCPLSNLSKAEDFNERLKNLKKTVTKNLTEHMLPPKISRERRYVNKLVVNNSTDFYTYSIKSEKQGIKEAIELSKKSDYEEDWIFIPKLNLWIETGLISKNSDKTKKVFEDRYLTNFYLRNYSSVFSVHTPPVFKDLSKEDRKFCAIKPSLDDLVFLYNQGKRFYSFHPKGNLVHKICSPYGHTTYSLKKPLETKTQDLLLNYKGFSESFMNTSKSKQNLYYNDSLVNCIYHDNQNPYKIFLEKKMSLMEDHFKGW